MSYQTTQSYKGILIGTGGQGRAWCEKFLPPNIKDGLIEIVACVDVNPAAFENAQTFLGLSPSQCYTDTTQAIEENPADFCIIVTPPAFHESAVDAALKHKLHILSEKPIADTLEASVRIAEKVKRANKKMGVTMSHRFDQDKTTLQQELRAEKNGKLDYLICRFTCNMRNFGDWGAAFRHTMTDPLMIEGSVHHLDMLANFAGAKCDTLYAQTWNPSWGSYGGDSQGQVILTFQNGVRAFYEGAKTNAIGLNGWTNEYVRAECEHATLIMDCRHIERHAYEGGRIYKREGQGQTIPMVQQGKWMNTWLVEQFIQWLDGGPVMETNIEDNLQSVALIFAAIESSRTNQSIKVQEFLENTREAVLKTL